MKKAVSNAPDAQAAAPQQFPFQHLLPAIPSGGLTPAHWLTLSERLRLATAAKSDSPVLNEAESQNFRQNCEIIRKAGIGLQLRNYSFLEVYETQQWRTDFQTVKDFAKQVAELSKSQFMKCIDSAKIALLMAEEGLGAVAPRGRQVEELAKVPPAHRLAAWRASLVAFELHGNSVSEAKHAMCNYCDEQNIKFGRREPNGSKKVAHDSTLRPDPSKETIVEPPQKSGNEKDWTENLSSTDDHTLIDILDLDILQDFFVEFEGTSPGKTLAKILQEVGLEHENNQTSKHMDAVLSLVSKKDPAMEGNLRKLALCLLSDAISQKLEKRILASRLVKEERLERAPIPNPMPSSILKFERTTFNELAPIDDNRKELCI